jgi:hypothetical protein
VQVARAASRHHDFFVAERQQARCDFNVTTVENPNQEHAPDPVSWEITLLGAAAPDC